MFSHRFVLAIDHVSVVKWTEKTKSYQRLHIIEWFSYHPILIHIHRTIAIFPRIAKFLFCYQSILFNNTWKYAVFSPLSNGESCSSVSFLSKVIHCQTLLGDFWTILYIRKEVTNKVLNCIGNFSLDTRCWFHYFCEHLIASSSVRITKKNLLLSKWWPQFSSSFEIGKWLFIFF